MRGFIMRRGNSTDIYIFLFTGVFLVVSVMALMAMGTSYSLKEAYEGIGFRQSAVLATYEEVDQYQQHTNIIAKYSVHEALLEYMKENYARCEKVGSYQSWSNCFVDVYTNPLLFTTIDENFKSMWDYPVRPAEYRYSVGENFVGESRQEIFFPILGVKGDSVREVASIVNKETSLLAESFIPDSVFVDKVLRDRGFSRESPITHIVINTTQSETLAQEEQRLLGLEETSHYLVADTVVQMIPEEQSSCTNCDYIRIILVGDENRLYSLVKDLLLRYELEFEDVRTELDRKKLEAEVEKVTLDEDQNLKSKIIWPVSSQSLSSCFGERELSGESDYHDGIDIAVRQGEDVSSIADGKVVDVCEEWVGECSCAAGGSSAEATACRERCSGKCGNFGNYVVIEHSDSLASRYSHLKSVDVSEGNSVRAGEKIGESGNTGYSFGPHLDLKIYSPASNWIKTEGGDNPLCFYNEDIIRNLQLTTSADSCKDKGSFEEEFADCDVNFQVESNRCFSEELETALTQDNQDKVNTARSRLQKWMPNIDAAAREYEIPRAFLLGIITQESVGDPNARSPTGALGLMQFVVDTARSPEAGNLRAVACGSTEPYKCTRENDDRLNPAKAIPAGAKYLRWLLDFSFIDGDLWLAAQAYNSGIGTVQNAVEACEGNSQLRSCVRDFIIQSNNEFGSQRYDPDYANEVMAHMAGFGGGVTGGTCENVNVKGLGSVEYRPDFAVEVPPVLSEFEELVKWAEELATTNNNLHDLDLDAPWEITSGFCTDEFANEASRQLLECKKNALNCSCHFDLPVGDYLFQNGFVSATILNENDEQAPTSDTTLVIKVTEEETVLVLNGTAVKGIKYNGSFVPSDTPACPASLRLQAFCAESESTLTPREEKVVSRFALEFNDTVLPEQALGASLVPLGLEPTSISFSFQKPLADDLSGVFIYCKWPGQEEFILNKSIMKEDIEEIHSLTLQTCGGVDFEYEPGKTYEVAVHSFDYGANENTEQTQCANVASFTVPEDDAWETALGTAFTGGWFEVYQEANEFWNTISGCSLLGN